MDNGTMPGNVPLSEGLGLPPERLSFTPDQMHAMLVVMAGDLKDARAEIERLRLDLKNFANADIEWQDALDAAVAAEREKWRGLPERVAADANRYGLEGLRMRCTVSETGSFISWEVAVA